jgi:hypothetical protein
MRGLRVIATPRVGEGVPGADTGRHGTLKYRAYPLRFHGRNRDTLSTRAGAHHGPPLGVASVATSRPMQCGSTGAGAGAGRWTGGRGTRGGGGTARATA